MRKCLAKSETLFYYPKNLRMTDASLLEQIESISAFTRLDKIQRITSSLIDGYSSIKVRGSALLKYGFTNLSHGSKTKNKVNRFKTYTIAPDSKLNEFITIEYRTRGAESCKKFLKSMLALKNHDLNEHEEKEHAGAET